MMNNCVLLVHAAWFDVQGTRNQEVLQSAAQRCVMRAWRAMEQVDRNVLDAISRAGVNVVVEGDNRAERKRLDPLKTHHFTQHTAVSLAFRDLAGER